MCLTVCNGTTCDTVTVPITVVPSGLVVVTPTSIVTPEDSTKTVCTSVVNSGGTALTPSITCGPNNGTATVTATNTSTVCITYTPNTNSASYTHLDVYKRQAQKQYVQKLQTLTKAH